MWVDGWDHRSLGETGCERRAALPESAGVSIATLTQLCRVSSSMMVRWTGGLVPLLNPLEKR